MKDARRPEEPIPPTIRIGDERMQTRSVPMRMCMGCSQMKPKKELVRVVRSAAGEILLDLTGKKSGRGAYVCKQIECLKKARKSRRIERSLGVEIPEAVYDAMEKELEQDAKVT